MEKIYISGPITGTDDFKERFSAAEAKMKDIFKGVEIINPVTLCAGMEGATWMEYMDKCIEGLNLCDGIYMMDGWENSKGATVEYFIARDNGMQLI